MQAKLIEYRWTVDTHMDPYSRSGDEKRCHGGILIPGKRGINVLISIPDVLVIMHDGTPQYRELSDHPTGNRLYELGIICHERDFKVIGKIEISEIVVQKARTMASGSRLAEETNSVFRGIFEDLIRKENR